MLFFSFLGKFSYSVASRFYISPPAPRYYSSVGYILKMDLKYDTYAILVLIFALENRIFRK